MDIYHYRDVKGAIDRGQATSESDMPPQLTESQGDALLQQCGVGKTCGAAAQRLSQSIVLAVPAPEAGRAGPVPRAGARVLVGWSHAAADGGGGGGGSTWR